MAKVTKIELKQKIYELHLQGWTNGQIARKLGLSNRHIVRFHLISYKNILDKMQKGGSHELVTERHV